MNKNTNRSSTAGDDRITKPQFAILLFIFTITAKICFLPSIMYNKTKESSFWVLFIFIILEGILALFAYYIAKNGGLQNEYTPTWLKKTFSLLLFILFGFKLLSFAFEASVSATNVLFDGSLTIPLYLLLVIGAGIIGAKGFSGIARTATLFAWGWLFFFIFNLLFLGIRGSGYNLYPLLRPSSIGEGILTSAVWFGDSSILLTLGIKKSEKDRKLEKASIPTLFIASSLILLLFFLLLIYTYGSASGSVENAFARVLLMNPNADELGAIDWPIIIIWLSMAIIQTASLFSASRLAYTELFRGKGKKERLKTTLFYVFFSALFPIFYFLIFKNSVNYTKIITSKIISSIALVLEYIIPITFALVIYINKRKEKHQVTCYDFAEENQ